MSKQRHSKRAAKRQREQERKDMQVAAQKPLKPPRKDK